MARHTARNISLIVALVAIVGAGIFVFIQFGTPQLLPNEIFSVIPANELPLLALTGFERQDITCFIKTTLLGEFTDGTFAEVSQSMFVGGTAGVAPTTLDLVRRTTGQVFKNLHIDGKVRCDFDLVSNGEQFFGWQVIPDVNRLALFASTNNLDGTVINLDPIQKFSSRLTLLDNREQTFVRFTIPASQIDALYSENVTPYREEFRTYLVGKLVFDFPSDVGQTKYGIEMKFPELYNHIFYNVEKFPTIIPSPIQLRDIQIEIRSVVQTLTGLRLDTGTNTLDTSSAGGRQIKIVGVAKTWDTSQPNPIINIEFRKTGTTTVTIASGVMTQVGLENDRQDGIFDFLFLFDRNSPEGEYLIKMTLQGRNTVSTRSLYINNTPDAPVPPTKETTTTPEEEITPPTTTEAKKQLETELLQGQLVNSFKVNFADGTFQQLIGDSGGANFVSRTGTLVPTASLIGALQDEPPNTIISVEYELFLKPPLTSDFKILFTDSNIRFKPKVIVSTAQEAEGSIIPQVGSSSTLSGSEKANVLNVGLAYTLGKVTISANTIEAIAEASGVTTGQRIEMDLLIEASGDVTFLRDTTVQKLDVTNTFVRLNKIIFDNQFIPDVNCQKAGLLDDPITGGCKLPVESDPTCSTPLRTNIKCDLNFINENCPQNDLTMCNEPDKDNDGVPDIQDDCASTFGLVANNGCPQGIIGDGEIPEPCPTSQTTCVKLTPPIFGGIICSSTNPDLCEGQLDITTLLIIGGIGLIIVGVIVFVIRRRR